jgi:hypothetical protein
VWQTIFKNAFRYNQHQHQHSTASDSDCDEEVDDDEDLETADVTPQEMETTEDNIITLKKKSSLEWNMRRMLLLKVRAIMCIRQSP